MKVSELIGQLTILMVKHGDVNVVVDAGTNFIDYDVINVSAAPTGREYEVDSIVLETT